MRRSLPLLVLLLAGTASCGGGGSNPQLRDRSGGEGASNATATYDMAPAAPQAAESGTAAQRAAGGPNIAPTAAPGVAFNYQ